MSFIAIYFAGNGSPFYLPAVAQAVSCYSHYKNPAVQLQYCYLILQTISEVAQAILADLCLLLQHAQMGAQSPYGSENGATRKLSQMLEQSDNSPLKHECCCPNHLAA